MTDVEIMIKALRLAWIPRLLTPEIRNWKTISDYYPRKYGGLNFLLRCNYDVKSKFSTSTRDVSTEARSPHVLQRYSYFFH